MGQFLEPLAHGAWPEMAYRLPCSSLPEGLVEECPNGGEINFPSFLVWTLSDYSHFCLKEIEMPKGIWFLLLAEIRHDLVKTVL